MAQGNVKIRPKRQDAHIMSAQESACLAWYMCAVFLMMAALGLLLVRKTMQPQYASLWLRPPGRRERYESEVEDV
jgi:hypothetical protein